MEIKKMPGSEPYQRACRDCGKMMIMGLNPSTSKWQPWDNFAAKVMHACSAKSSTTTTTMQTPTITTNESVSSEQQQQHSTVSNDKLNEKLDLLLWIAEKTAKKVGVELDEQQQQQQ